MPAHCRSVHFSRAGKSGRLSALLCERGFSVNGAVMDTVYLLFTLPRDDNFEVHEYEPLQLEFSRERTPRPQDPYSSAVLYGKNKKKCL